jgi:outer membrane protein TolC
MRSARLGVLSLCLLASPLAHADNGKDDLTAWAGPSKPTTLPELLTFAVQHAPALASARIDIAIAEARIEQTWGRDDWLIRSQLLGSRVKGGAFSDDDYRDSLTGSLDVGRLLPTNGTIALHAGTTYTDSLTSQPIDPDGPGPMESALVEFPSTTWNSEVSATITQPLLRDRGRFIYEANERRARLSRDATVLARRQVAIETVQTVVSAYWDLVLAERQVAITRASLDLAKERLRITQIGADGGKVPRSEIPAVQQIIATREEDVLNGELAVIDRSIALRRATGMPIGKGELGLRVGMELAPREAAFELGELSERAFAASPELAQLAKQDAVTRIDIEVTENGLLPRLDAALTLGTAGGGETSSEAWSNLVKLEGYAVSGSLTFEHSIGQETVRGLAREQRANRKKLEVTAFDLRALIAQTMSRAVAQLEVARRRVALSQRAIDLANENIKIESDRFNLGKATNFDVLNRQEELRQAELRKAQAMIDWHKAEAVVQALTGDILPVYGIAVD